MNVVVVESPAKAKTINKYLGSDYHVVASYGHIRDLPPKDGSVDPEQTAKHADDDVGAMVALEMCRDYLMKRKSFGKRLGEHQLIQKMIADNASAIHAGNLMTFHCAQMLEAGLGREARVYSSMTKNHVAVSCRSL